MCSYFAGNIVQIGFLNKNRFIGLSLKQIIIGILYYYNEIEDSVEQAMTIGPVTSPLFEGINIRDVKSEKTVSFPMEIEFFLLHYN